MLVLEIELSAGSSRKRKRILSGPTAYDVLRNLSGTEQRTTGVAGLV